MSDTNSLPILRPKKGCILTKDLKVGSLKSARKKDIVEISPCTSERGKVMAEIDLSPGGNRPFLDIKVLHEFLESYRTHFAEMKCSRNLGVARVMWKAHRLHIYKNGKFKVRYAHSREDAIQIMNSALQLIYGSVICERCERPAVDCSLGKCETCTASKYSQVAHLDGYFSGPLLVKGFDSLENSLKRSRELRRCSFSKGREWPTEVEKSMRRGLREAIEYGMSFSLETRETDAPRMGVMLSALALENLLLLKLERVLVESIFGEVLGEFKTLTDDLNDTLWQMNEDLVRGLRMVNQRNLEKVEKGAMRALGILDEIQSIVEQSRGGRNTKEVLKELEKHVIDSKIFLKRISCF